jgi:ATP-dependent exoDNAse (exonuclease V) alpha subunit
VAVDTGEFSDLSLSYAVHVYKAQGITAETSGVLIGGWQTDREHAYVALSRARKQTQVYVAREDLGDAGLDVGAIERLGERMRQSGAQEASVAKEVAEKAAERQTRIGREIDCDRTRYINRDIGLE